MLPEQTVPPTPGALAKVYKEVGPLGFLIVVVCFLLCTLNLWLLHEFSATRDTFTQQLRASQAGFEQEMERGRAFFREEARDNRARYELVRDRNEKNMVMLWQASEKQDKGIQLLYHIYDKVKGMAGE